MNEKQKLNAKWGRVVTLSKITDYTGSDSAKTVISFRRRPRGVGAGVHDGAPGYPAWQAVADAGQAEQVRGLQGKE